MKSVWSVLMAVVAGAVLIAQADINSLGPQVGARAIAFRLTDQRGATQTLDSLAGKNGTMLVFFRSADW